MGNKNSSLKDEDANTIPSTTAHPTSPETQKKLKKNKSLKNKNSSNINIPNHTNKDTNKDTKNKKYNDKRSKSTDNLTNKASTPTYTPSVFKSPSNPPTDHLGNKQLSCIIMPDQELDIKVYKKNRDSIADKHLTIQRSQRTRSLQRSRSSALRKSTDTLTSTSSRQPSRYVGSSGYQTCLTLEEDAVWNDVPDGIKGVIFPCEEKIQRHKLVFQRSFQELFVDYYYTSLQEVVQLSAIIIAYKRVVDDDDGEVSYDPINLFQYINVEGDLPVELFVAPNDSIYIPALPLSTLTSIKTLRGEVEGVSEVGVEDQLCVCHELVRCVVMEACREVTGVFEYQLSILSDQVSVETVARHAAERAIEYLRSGNRFVERDSIVEGVAYLPIEEAVTNNKTHFVSAILGEDREFKWDVAKMFTSCAIRLYPSQAHYYNYDPIINPSNDNWENVTFMANSQCLPLVYGYRGAIFKKDIESCKDVISQVDLDLFTGVVGDHNDDVHRYYVPIDVKKKKAMIRSLFRHPNHRNTHLKIPQSPSSSCSSRYYNRNSFSMQQDNNNNYNSQNYNNYNDAAQQNGRSSKQSGVILVGDEVSRLNQPPMIPGRSTITSVDSDATIVNGEDTHKHTYTYSTNNHQAINGIADSRRLTENVHYAYDNNTHYNQHNGYNNNSNINNNLNNNLNNNGRFSSQSERPEVPFPRRSRVTQSYHTMHQPTQQQYNTDNNNAYNNNNINAYNNAYNENENQYPHNNYNYTNINHNNNQNICPTTNNNNHIHHRNLVKRKPNGVSPTSNNITNPIIETSFDYNSDQVLVNEVMSNHVIPNGVISNEVISNGVLSNDEKNDINNNNGDYDIINGYDINPLDAKNVNDNNLNHNIINNNNSNIDKNNNTSNVNCIMVNNFNGRLPPKPPQRTVSSSRQSVKPGTLNHAPLKIHITSKVVNAGVNKPFNAGAINHVNNGAINGISNGMSNIMSNGMSNGSIKGISNCALNGVSEGLSNGVVNGNGAEVNGNRYTNGANCQKDVLDFSSFLKLVEKQNNSLKSFDQKIESYKSSPSKNNFTPRNSANSYVEFTQHSLVNPPHVPLPSPPHVPLPSPPHVPLPNLPQSPISNRPRVAFSNV